MTVYRTGLVCFLDVQMIPSTQAATHARTHRHTQTYIRLPYRLQPSLALSPDRKLDCVRVLVDAGADLGLATEAERAAARDAYAEFTTDPTQADAFCALITATVCANTSFAVLA